MINVNDDFKIDIRTHGRQFDVQLKANNIDIDNDNLNYLKPAFNTTLFKTVMHQIEIDSKVYVPNKTKITGKIGVKVNKKTYNYIDLNTYYVKSCERQEDTNSYRILAYTKMQEAMVDNELELTAKLTVRNYLLAVCQKLNWNTDNIPESFINSNKLIDPTLHIGIKYTYRDILDEIATITCSFLLFKGDNLYLIYPTETNQNIDESYLDEDNITIGAKYIINSLVFSRAEESDNIFRKDDTSIAINGLHEYRISDCQLLSTNDRSDYIDAMFNYLKTLGFYIFDVQSKGILFLEACDIFNFVLNEVTYKTILLNNEIELDDGLTEKLYTDEPEETETEYKYADSTDKRIDKAYILVDKQNKRITQLTKETTENTQKITNVEQDVNGITSKVSSVEQSVENITKIEGTAEGKNIYIDDASAEPLIDIMLEGESQQATRSGKNRANLTRDTFTNNGVTFTNNGDGTYTLNGTATAGMDNNLLLTEKHFEVSPNNFYRLSIKEFNGSMSGNGFALANLKIEEKITWGWIGSTTHAKKPEAIGTIVMINYYIGQGAIFNNYKIGIQMEVVDSATAGASSWEPYGASPSPDYPSPIKNVEGKNKFNYLWFDTTKEVAWTAYQGITSLAKAIPIFIGKGKVATFSSNVPLLSSDNLLYAINDLTKSSSASFALGKTQTIKANNEGYVYVGYVKSRTNYNKVKDGTYYVQVEEGTVAKPYVPYNSLEIKDVGENLLDLSKCTFYNCKLNPDGASITSNISKAYYCELKTTQLNDYLLANKGKTVTFLTGTLLNKTTTVIIYGTRANGSTYQEVNETKTGKCSITVANDFTTITRVEFRFNRLSTVFTDTSTIINYAMLVLGTEEITYKPYQEQTEYFPLSEGQKLMKGSYLADDGTHYKRKQVVLDGSDNMAWYMDSPLPKASTDYFYTRTVGITTENINSVICSHFKKGSRSRQGFWATTVFCITMNRTVTGIISSDTMAQRITKFKTWLATQYANGTPVIVEYELAEEEIVPYTEEQKAAWEKLRHFTLFKGINNITSTANAKITYVRDNGLSDTYETKRNVKENHYTKSETDSQISQTADSIKESVKEINEQTQEKLATLELANQSLEFSTKRTGGNNLIRNSAMINDNNFWLAHAKYPYQESDTPPDNPTEGAYWYCTANSGSYIENQMYVYNSGWQVSELSRKSLLSAQNYFAYTTSNEYWANGKNANENTLSGRVIKLDGRQDYTVSHIFNITEPITLNQNENKMAISHFIKNSIVQGNVCVGLMFLNEADFTEVEKPYSLYEPGIILTPDDLKDLTKIEQIIEIPKKSDFIPVVVSNTAPTDTTKNWLDTTIYLPKKYNSQTSQWEILDTKMSLYNESSREVWTYRYFYGFYYQTPIIYDTAEIKSCYVALTFYPAFAVYTGNVEPTPYKGLYWNNKTTNLVKRAKYNDTTFVEWETLDIPSSLLPTGASLSVELFDYIVPIKGFVEIADLKLEYNTMCTQWTQFPGEVYGKNYKMDEKGFWIQANQNTMFIDEDEILATYKGINIFQINKDLAYFYKIQATESIEIGNYFLKTQQINSKNMLLLY